MTRAFRFFVPCILVIVGAIACTTGTVGSAGDGGSSDPNDPQNPPSSTNPTDPDDPSSSSTVSSHAEQTNGACPSRPEKLTGTGAAGATCSTFADCKPSCCACSGGTSYLAAACVDNVCGTSAVACARPRKAYCGSSSEGDGGSSSGGPKPAKVCVAGSSLHCSGTGMTWTGTECCVDAPATCTLGSSLFCSGPKMKWTGLTCCVSGNLQCVEGFSLYCSGTGMNWTGYKCCVSPALSCVPGTSSSCSGPGKHWTGALCCVD